MPLWSLPSIFGSAFTYERLEGASRTHIRLLELISCKETSRNAPDQKIIECRISTFPLDQAPKYEALSYEWGNPAQGRLSIRLVESRVPMYKYSELRVTRNVYAALKRLRLSSNSRLLWIDQVCIDQAKTEENLAEKTDQIFRMKDIYQTAEKTLIWLGDDDANTSIVAEIVHRLPPMPEYALSDTSYLQRCDQEVLYELIDYKVCKDGLARSRRDALHEFLNRQWFGRAWVYQEAVVSSDVEVILGEYLFSFDLLVRLVYSAYNLVEEDPDRNTSRALKRTKGYGTLRTMWVDRQRLQKEEKLNLLRVLWSARKYLEASEPRDMVYSFLGVQNLDGCPVEADSSAKATPIFPSSSAWFLYGIRSKTIPSWVPDWSQRPFLSGAPIVAPGSKCLFNASLDTEHSSIERVGFHKELHVKAHLIDHITKVLAHKCEIFRSELGYRSILHHPKDRETALRAVLMDRAFSPMQPVDIENSMSELLRIYDADQPKRGGQRDILSHRYLRTTASVAAGKRFFVTGACELGVGYLNIEEGDRVAILHGCKTPCILRPSWKHPGSERHFVFIGQCYVDGWMYGEKLNKREKWKEEAQVLVLI